MTDSVAVQRSKTSGRIRTLLVLALIFAGCGFAAWYYQMRWGQYEESTDDAYVQGHDVAVHAQTAGIVTDVPVDDTQQVSEGAPLVVLDSTDAVVQRQQAALVYAHQLGIVREQCALVQEDVAAIHEAQVRLQMAQSDWRRRKPLLHTAALATEDAVHAQEAVQLASAAIAVAEQKKRVDAAQVISCNPQHNPVLLNAREQYIGAVLRCERMQVRAPLAGMISRRHVQVGQSIKASDILMTVVPLSHVWVDANFKENQLRHIRIGQPVILTSDVYGTKVIYHGRVEGLSAGSGSAFALLPPQNAVGNWIKVVQRLPVRIAIEPVELVPHPLRVGLSIVAMVDTHDRSGAGLAVAAFKTEDQHTAIYSHQLAEAEKAADQMVVQEGHL